MELGAGHSAGACKTGKEICLLPDTLGYFLMPQLVPHGEVGDAFSLWADWLASLGWI